MRVTRTLPRLRLAVDIDSLFKQRQVSNSQVSNSQVSNSQVSNSQVSDSQVSNSQVPNSQNFQTKSRVAPRNIKTSVRASRRHAPESLKETMRPSAW